MGGGTRSGTFDTFDLNPASVLGVGWLGSKNIRKSEVLVTGWVTLKPSGAKMLEGTGTIPESLVVTIENIAKVIEANAAGGTDAITSWNRLSIRSHPHTPTAKGALVIGASGAGQAKNHPDIAILVVTRSKSVLVIVAIDAPPVSKSFEYVGSTIAVTVFDAGNLGTLRKVEPTVFPGYAEHFVQPSGEKTPFGFGIFTKNILPDEDVSSA